MISTTETDQLPLLYQTPDRWGVDVLKTPLALLSDHAYLERKAATNALELFNRWPTSQPPETWIVTLASIARDEALHLHAVIRILKERGGQLDRRHRSSYASDLRLLVRAGTGPSELVDRLLVSALIEARSCERFGILARVSDDTELAQFYRGLWSSELGHYTVFLKLAEQVETPEPLEPRWRQMLELESDIIQRQPVGHSLHSRPRDL